ncbi:MAG: hypothetical protein MHM6MM_005610 [Cercozoa sp. M6MM]
MPESFQCLLGMYCPDGGRASTAARTSEILCAEGFFCSAVEVQKKCPPGNFCPAGSIKPTPCEKQGRFCPAGSVTDAQLCESGFYCPKTAEQIRCPHNHYCPYGTVKPIECGLFLECLEGSSFPTISFVIPLVVLILAWLFYLLRVGIVRYNKNKESDATQQGVERDREVALMDAFMSHSSTLTVRKSTTMETEMEQMQQEPYEIQMAQPDNSLILFFSTLQRKGPGQRIDIVFRDLASATNDRLKPCSGTLVSGELTYVLGPSGSGKSTFLKAISMRTDASELQGEVSLVRPKRGDSLPIVGPVVQERSPVDRNAVLREFGYVPQENCIFDNLTIRQNLDYSLRQRPPRGWTRERCGQVIDDVLRVLGLIEVQHHMGKVLSGGELKRVNIGMEVVCYPSVLLVDEPTSGLDATAATVVVSALRQLANMGITVVCILHQPRPQIFNLGDRLILFTHGGRLCYNGELRQACDYFAKGGYVRTASTPADWLLDILSGTVSNSRDRGTRIDRLSSIAENRERMYRRWLQTVASRKLLVNALHDSTMDHDDLACVDEVISAEVSETLSHSRPRKQTVRPVDQNLVRKLAKVAGVSNMSADELRRIAAQELGIHNTVEMPTELFARVACQLRQKDAPRNNTVHHDRDAGNSILSRYYALESTDDSRQGAGERDLLEAFDHDLGVFGLETMPDGFGSCQCLLGIGLCEFTNRAGTGTNVQRERVAHCNDHARTRTCHSQGRFGIGADCTASFVESGEAIRACFSHGSDAEVGRRTSSRGGFGVSARAATGLDDGRHLSYGYGDLDGFADFAKRSEHCCTRFLARWTQHICVLVGQNVGRIVHTLQDDTESAVRLRSSLRWFRGRRSAMCWPCS